MLKLTNINKYYGTHHTLKDVCIEGKSGDIIKISGASGEGKTTLLRCICGLEKFEAGIVEIDDKVVQTEKIITPPHKRKIGLVFQDFALWPHMTVWQNIDFVSSAAIRNKTERKSWNQECLTKFRIDHKMKSYPSELSGGEQQRVALARSIAGKPKILLLDEPFTNLDTTLTKKIIAETIDYATSQKILLILVTHSDTIFETINNKSYVLFNGNLKPEL
jgi:ABC-type Fe3+/spermidine/putrescine transport system ATPase subunit